eukprot:g30090.t1
MEDSEVSAEHSRMLGHFETKKEVTLVLLKSIKVDTSPGPDGFYCTLLTDAREEITGAFTKIFVSSPATGDIPEDWRVANVVPLYKKGKQGNSKKLETKSLQCGNRTFGPTSLHQPAEHLIQTNPPITHLIYTSLKHNGQFSMAGRAVYVVYMGCSKTFDKVPHGRLIEKINVRGIQ